MQVTSKELAEITGIDPIVTNGFISFLSKRGIIKEAGRKYSVGGRGKPSIVWEIPETLTISLGGKTQTSE
jgi:hypothetical protein